MMKTLLLHACAFLALSLPVTAEIIGVEQFDYPDGAIADQNGGTFWDFGNIAAPVHDGTPSLWQNIVGTPATPAVASGRLVTNGNSALRPHNGPSLGFGNDEEKGSVTDGNRLQQVVYHRVTFTTGATVPDFLGLSTYDFSTEKIFFGKRFGQSVFGIETTNGFGLQDSAVTIAANTTYTLVAKVDYVNNRLSLWINPTFGGTEPAANAVINGYTTNNFSTGVRLASGSGGSGSAVTWDNLISATTWAEVGGTVVTTTADEDDGLTSLNTPTDISLREAVKYSASGSLITFASGLSGQTITLGGTQMDVPTGRSLTVDASDLPNGITLDGNGASRHFNVDGGEALTLRGLTLTRGNGSGGSGGSILNLGTLNMMRCTLNENTTGGGTPGGGAISNEGMLSLTTCTLTGNSSGFGGAIEIFSGTGSLTYCTLSGNATTVQGGAIYKRGNLTLTNTIVAGNALTAGNLATNGPDIFLESGSPITTTGVNLIGNLTGSGLTAGTTVIVGDPKLSPLGYFGGQVQTMHPLIGSPAIDAAGTTNPGGTDARGFPRFVDGDASGTAQIDIGAVEAGPLRTVAFSSDSISPLRLRSEISAGANTPGTRIGFNPANFPAPTISLSLGQIDIPATASIFIDASNLSGPVTVSGGNASRVFNIAAGATVAMHSVKIVNGNAFTGDGGGIFNEGTCSLFFSNLSLNSAADGGAITNSGTCTLFASTLMENSAAKEGGAIAGFGGVLKLTQCTFSSNSAGTPNDTGGGGAISCSGATLALTQCTLSGNNSVFGGGAVSVANGRLVLRQCTLSGNSASFGSGVSNRDNNQTTLINSIVAGNTGTDIYLQTGSLVRVGKNLVQSLAKDLFFSSTDSGPPAISVDPLLAPLADNGGPTQTMALLSGSPARDAATGSTLLTDQRGFPLVGTADVGAYEAQIGSIADVTLIESQTPPTRTFSVGQIGALTVTSSNTKLLPLVNIVLSGTGASRSITVTPAVSQFGSSLITLTEDLRGETLTFTLTVNPVAGTVVLNTNDSGAGSLRAAMSAAAGAGGLTTITFAPGFTGPIALTSGEIVVTDSDPVVIDATALPRGLTVDGNNASRHFSVGAGKSLTLRGLTLTGGNGAGAAFTDNGGAISSGGTLTLTQCTLSGNSSGQGGAISNGGVLALSQCTFADNSCSGTGGAIYNGNNGTLTLTHCTLSGNTASSGGAIYTRGTVTLNNTIVAGNRAPSGPDIFRASGTSTPTGVNLLSNLAESGLSAGTTVIVGTAKLSSLGYFGGPTQTMHPLIGSPAIDAGGTTDPGGTDQRGFPRFVDGDVSGTPQLDIGAVEAGPLRNVAFNSDAGSNGSLRTRIDASTEPGARIGFVAGNFFPSTITLNGTELTIPVTANGLFIDASNLSGPVTVSGNNASRVFNIAAGATVAMHSLKIVGGKIDNGIGGGILNNGTCTVLFSTISGNSAVVGSGHGAGIYNNGTCMVLSSTLNGNSGGAGSGIFNNGTCTVLSSTLSGNVALAAGGINNAGTCTVLFSTVSGNSAGLRGGGIKNSGPFFHLASSIVAGNTSVTGPDIDGFVPPGPNNLITTDPLLAPLADNGGPTQTMALLPGSPARNAATGSTRLTDQRGFAIVGTTDIGAYEAQIGSIANVSLVESEAPPTRTFGVGQIGALTVASSNTDLLPLANIVLSGSGASRSITVAPAVSQFGSSLITLTEDLRGETQTFTLTVSRVTGTVVTNANDSGVGSLRAALSAAAGAAGLTTVTFGPGFTGPIALTSGELLLADSDPVVIDASSVSGGVVLNAGANARHFQVPAGNTLTLRNLTLQGGNASGDGGSIYSAGTLILERCTLSFNHSAFSGGAVVSVGPLFRAVDCTFADNTANGEGGGILCQGSLNADLGASAELVRCTISGNGGTGLVLRLSSGNLETATLHQCTITNNTGNGDLATGGMGGIGSLASGTLTLIHCTVFGNASGSGLTGFRKCGGLFINAGTVNLTNSIIAGNTASGGAPADISFKVGAGILTPKGANLIGSNQSVEAIFPAGPLVGTAAAPRDPLLYALNNYGGLTKTVQLAPDSPAIDQATVLDPALTTDQRGEPRPLGVRPDIGAVEALFIVVTTPVDELDPPGSPGAGFSLREAIRDVPTDATIVFDRAVFNNTNNIITLTKGPLNQQRTCVLDGRLIPGGIKVVYAPTITTQPVPQRVNTGAAVTFSVGVTNLSGGIAAQWRRNGVPIGDASLSYTITNAQEADEGLYDVEISEAAITNVVTNNVDIGPFSIISQPASLVVNGAPVKIQRSPSNAMIALGSSRTLSVVAVGPTTPALTYQWFKAGKAISGAAKSSYVITNAQLTHAGAYTCVVKSGTTSVTSTTAEIGVVDARPKTVNLALGGTFAPSVSAAGSGTLTYLWSSGQTTKSFTKTVAVMDAGLYTCTVTGLAGSFTGGAPTTLNVSNAAPSIITPLALPTAFIGQAYFYTLPVSATAGARPTSFSMTGTLPSGMSFNKTTGVLSGRPTTTKTGGYALSFKAGNATAFSQPVTATLTVNVVPPLAVGTFAGPMVRSPLNDNLGGRFDLTTTASGLCSGSVTLGARAAIRFTNQLLLSAGAGDAILRANIPGITLADKTVLIAYLEVFAVDQRAMLTLVHPTNRSTLQVPGWRNPWFISKTPALNKPATAYAARYNLRLDAGSGSSTSPNGYGYASFTVNNAGALTLTGKLPDGSGVTGGTFVSKDGEILLFNLLHGNRGSQVGQFNITKAAAVVDNALNGSTTWLKPGPLPKSTDTVYKAGFGPLTVTALGGVYVAPAKGAVVPGFTAIGPGQTNAGVSFGQGGLTTGFSQLLRIANPSAAGLTNTAIPALPLTNTTKITTFTASSGLFIGSFTINGASATLSRPAPFFGQLVKIGGTTEGYGYFLLPQVPVGTEKVSTAPKLSGRVVLAVP